MPAVVPDFVARLPRLRGRKDGSRNNQSLKGPVTASAAVGPALEQIANVLESDMHIGDMVKMHPGSFIAPLLGEAADQTGVVGDVWLDDRGERISILYQTVRIYAYGVPATEFEPDGRSEDVQRMSGKTTVPREISSTGMPSSSLHSLTERKRS